MCVCVCVYVRPNEQCTEIQCINISFIYSIEAGYIQTLSPLLTSLLLPTTFSNVERLVSLCCVHASKAH